MKKLPNIHPGEVLLEEFFKPLEISAYKLAKDTDMPQTRISQIIKGKRRITADTALRLASYFGTSAKEGTEVMIISDKLVVPEIENPTEMKK